MSTVAHTRRLVEMARNAERSGGLSVESLMAELLPQAQGEHAVEIFN